MKIFPLEKPDIWYIIIVAKTGIHDLHCVYTKPLDRPRVLGVHTRESERSLACVTVQLLMVIQYLAVTYAL